jgi:hypothetical protein
MRGRMVLSREEERSRWRQTYHGNMRDYTKTASTKMTNKGILRDMKNILSAYNLCKYLRQNGKLHVCPGFQCDVYGKIGEERIELFEKKQKKGKVPRQVNEHVLVVDLYRGEYFDIEECLQTRKSYVYLRNKGVVLADNLILPFTPINLWKEIWKEHKVIFTILPPIITLVTGTSVIKLVQWGLSRLP